MSERWLVARELTCLSHGRRTDAIGRSIGINTLQASKYPEQEDVKESGKDRVRSSAGCRWKDDVVDSKSAESLVCPTERERAPYVRWRGSAANQCTPV